MPDSTPKIFLYSLAALTVEVGPDAALAVLDEPERLTWQRAKAPARRAECLYGRYAAKTAIGRELGVEACKIVLVRGHGGKPEIVAADGRAVTFNIAFNVSHARGIVAIALAGRGQIGVDVEAIDDSVVPDRDAIAQRHFSAAEAQAIAQAGSERASLEFFRLWTLKEAALKACGLGLGVPLDRVTITRQGDGYAIAVPDSGVLQAWHWNLTSRCGCPLALAWASTQAAAIPPGIFDLTRPGDWSADRSAG